MTVVSINRSSKRNATAAWCTYAALLLEEVPATWATDADGRRRLVDADLDVVASAWQRIRDLGDEAMLELRAEYERRLAQRVRPTSRYFTLRPIGELVGERIKAG